MSSAPAARSFGLTAWLVVTVAAIGFLFDTYELLMTPLVLAPALSEIFASDGSDFAKLFAAYMTAPANKQAAAPAGGGTQVASPSRP